MNNAISLQEALQFFKSYDFLDESVKIPWSLVNIHRIEEAEFFTKYTAKKFDIKVIIKLPTRIQSLNNKVLNRILDALPKWITNLQVDDLYFSFDNLKTQMPALKILTINSYMIESTKVFPATLEELYAPDTSLTFTDAKVHLPQLKKLNAFQTEIVHLNELPKSLEYLDVSYCENIVYEDISEALPNLKTFIAEYTTIISEGAQMNYIMFPPSLVSMKLNHSNLHVFNELGARYHFKNLKKLHFEEAQIRSIGFLPPSLEKLFVPNGENMSDSFPPNIASVLPNLKLLNVNNIKLEEKQYILPPSLTDLSIDDNPFSYFRSDSFLGLNLEIFSAVKSGFDNRDLQFLPKSLDSLDLSSNDKITEWNSLGWRTPKLTYLEASDTKLASVATLPKSLEYLVVNNCVNITFRTARSALPNLKELVAKGTNLQDLRELPPSLEYLEVGDNITSTEGIERLVNLQNKKEVRLAIMSNYRRKMAGDSDSDDDQTPFDNDSDDDQTPFDYDIDDD